MREPRAPRRLIRQAIAQCNPTGESRVVSVSRLDATRWHIRLAHKGSGSPREIYLSPEDGGLLYVTTTDANVHITLYGDLGEDCVRNLGDCLVKALCEKAWYIDIWLGGSACVPAAAAHILESLGRHLTQTSTLMDVAIHGPDQAVALLTKAFVRGAARAQKRGALS